MRKRSIGFGMLAALLAGGVQAASAQDARAADVLGKVRAAIGKVDTVKSLGVEAAMQRNIGSAQLAGDIELLIEMPDKYVKREETRGMMAMTMATGFNGDRAIMPAGGTLGAGGRAMVIRMGPGGAMQEGARPTPEQLEQTNALVVRNARAEASRFLLGWLGMAHPSLNAEYTYAGEAESPDGRAHVIDVRNADGFSARLFIDPNNYLPLMLTYRGQAPRIMTTGPMRTAQGAAPAAQAQGGGKPLNEDGRGKMQQELEEKLRREMSEQPPIEFSIFFDDWREVDGITFPHVMRRAVAGETSEEWTITKVRINPKIDAKKFAVETK